MKALFLDIDGVMSINHGKIDCHKVVMINKIIQYTDCHIVLSSSWRLNSGLCMSLFDDGILFEHSTPDLSTPDDEHGAVHRASEIRLWLDQHPEVTAYAILDGDQESLVPYADKLIATNHKVGLTLSHVHRAIAMLNETKE